ncbi:MAG: oligosaccharide flippase family protein [Patescibacteria group bacterium]
MKDLGKWQIISFISRMTAMAVGILQSYFILKILSVGEWGTIRTALSLGSALGIYQHLGLAGASTREIAGAKTSKEVFQIFFTSTVIRYMISLPLAVGLFVSAGFLSQKYNNPEIINLIRIYAFVMVAQGVQGIFNAVISGMKKFKRLFIYQAAISLVSLALYLPLIWFYKVNGYFYALLTFNIVSSISLAFLAFRPLRDWFEMPSIKEFMTLFKELFSISMAIFLVKIIYTNWENIGPNLLGLSVTAEVVGIFGFAMLYAKKILAVSDAVTDVNLAVFSDKYQNNRVDFTDYFRKNFNKIFVFILPLAFTAIFWSKEVVQIVGLFNKYSQAIILILPIVFAFVFYSFLDIIKSSVLVPAKMGREMTLIFIMMLVSTIAFYFGTRRLVNPLTSMSYAMCFGTAVSLLMSILLSKARLGVWLFTHEHYTLIAQALVISFASNIQSLPIKMASFILLTALYVWAVKVSNFVDFKSLWQKYLKRPF